MATRFFIYVRSSPYEHAKRKARNQEIFGRYPDLGSTINVHISVNGGRKEVFISAFSSGVSESPVVENVPWDNRAEGVRILCELPNGIVWINADALNDFSTLCDDAEIGIISIVHLDEECAGT